MFKSPPNSSPEASRDSGYEEALRSLKQIVVELENGVKEKSVSLEDTYQAEALRMLSDFFVRISLRFVRHTRQKDSTLYEVINRSQGRKQAAIRIINSSQAVAKLFEGYARKPRSYSRVTSRIKIEVVLTDLSNLKARC